MPNKCQILQIYYFRISNISPPRPVGRALGIADTKKRSPAPNAVLEAAFQLGPRQRDLKQLASHTGMSDRYCTVLYCTYCTALYCTMSDRQISVWMRMRNLATK